MKRRHTQSNSGSAKPVSDRTDSLQLAEKEIDRLYGLEPVINVDDVTGVDSEATPYVVIACPYCGESFETKIDLTCGSFDYVEDCQICCQPINLKIAVNDAAELTGVTALQLND